jgi:hypothetical protein
VPNKEVMSRVGTVALGSFPTTALLFLLNVISSMDDKIDAVLSNRIPIRVKISIFILAARINCKFDPSHSIILPWTCFRSSDYAFLGRIANYELIIVYGPWIQVLVFHLYKSLLQS